MLVLLCNRYNETKIGSDELVFCTLTLRSSLAYLLRKFNFLIYGY